MTNTSTILTTERLRLRTWLDADLPLMAAISADLMVMEHFPAIQDLASTQTLIDNINKQYALFGYTLYAVETKAKHEFIGYVGLAHPGFNIPGFVAKGLPIVEIGWRLASQHWGKGYATEAANAVLRYAFVTLKLPEIISFTTVKNIKSRRVMEKIGLQHHAEDDFNHPRLDATSPLLRHVLYRLTQDEFAKKL